MVACGKPIKTDSFPWGEVIWSRDSVWPRCGLLRPKSTLDNRWRRGILRRNVGTMNIGRGSSLRRKSRIREAEVSVAQASFPEERLPVSDTAKDNGPRLSEEPHDLLGVFASNLEARSP